MSTLHTIGSTHWKKKGGEGGEQEEERKQEKRERAVIFKRIEFFGLLTCVIHKVNLFAVICQRTTVSCSAVTVDR